MQATIMNTETSQLVHVKVTNGEETRRFLLEDPSYERLLSTLKTLFALHPNTVLDLKYQDDEEDWVTILSEEEFVYAATLAVPTLRLRLTAQKEAPKAVEEKTDSPNFPHSRGGKCKWGRGKWMEEMAETEKPDFAHHGFPHCKRGRGARGGKGQWGPHNGKCHDGEELSKSEKISRRIAHTQAWLDSGNVPQERLPKVQARLEKLQQKLEVSKILDEEKTSKPFDSKSERLNFRIAQLQAKIDSGELSDDRVRTLQNRVACMKEKLSSMQNKPFPAQSPKGHPGPRGPRAFDNDEDWKKAKLARRIEILQAKIDSGEFPEERVRVFQSRLEQMKAQPDKPTKFQGCRFGRNPEQITARISNIQAKIDSGKLSVEQANILRSRMKNLQAKLEEAQVFHERPAQERPCPRKFGGFKNKNPEKLAARIAKLEAKILAEELSEDRLAVLKFRLDKLKNNAAQQ